MRQRCVERPRFPVIALPWLLVVMLGVGGWQHRVHAASHMIDLTYSFDETTLVWPSNPPFQRDGSARGGTVDEAWYATGQVGIDGIPVERLMGPAVVIDVRGSAAKEADYRLSLADLHRWESQYGTIPPGSLVMMLTGWGAHWKHRERYFGSATPDVPTTLHFPGFSEEAARFLTAERHIAGVGVDTPSIDYGPSQDFVVHRIVNGAGLYGLENVARLDELPPSGATLIALPMKIAGGSGAPVRILGIVPE